MGKFTPNRTNHGFLVLVWALALCIVSPYLHAANNSSNMANVKPWYAVASFSKKKPKTTQADSNTSPISKLSIASKSGASYRKDFSTWSLSNTTGKGISFTVNLTQVNGLQLRLEAAAAIVDGVPNCPLWITVNGKKIFKKKFNDKNDQWHDVNWNVREEHLKVGKNTIEIYLDSSASTQYFIKKVTFNPLVNSYYAVDFSSKKTNPKVGFGSSPITAFTFSTAKSSGYSLSTNPADTFELKPTGKLSFNLSLDKLTMLQFALRAIELELAANIASSKATNNCSINVAVKGKPAIAKPCSDLSDSNNLLYQIPQADLAVGNNTIEVTLTNTGGKQIYFSSAAAIPQKIYSKNGILNTTIYAQFGDTDAISGVSGFGKSGQYIWTRGYGLKEDVMMIPAPTFHYKPTEILNVNLVNELNRKNLAKFEKAEADNLTPNFPANPSADEVLDNVADKIKHEVNIPHNLNNTNLHVHGLHVDPSKDDVTIVIVPEGETDRGYDAPHSHTPTATGLDEGSVSDQSVKGGGWDYQYKIPQTHLPGTHWYHPHKHGSTSAQVENGMAGSMVIEESCLTGIKPIVPCPGATNSSNNPSQTQTNYNRSTWKQKHDRILMIQEITNYGSQKGAGNSKGIINKDDITVNGEFQPTYTLNSGQLERWRLINAGTNHNAFSQLWLGQTTNETDAKGQPVYLPATMHLVAVDGVTLDEIIEITPSNPLLLGPGNRADVLVQLSGSGKNGSRYDLFKYYPTNISIARSYSIKGKGRYLLDCSTSPCTGPLQSLAGAPASNPYLFKPYGIGNNSSNSTGENFAGYTQNWKAIDSAGNVTPATTLPVVPLIKVQPKSVTSKSSPTKSNILMDVNFALTSSSAFPATTGNWAPLYGAGGGGAKPIPGFKLLTAQVNNSPAANSPDLPINSYLRTISPGPKGALTSGHAYVSEITDDKILQSRPVIFDRSGASATVTANNNGSKGSSNVKQFTLNGRTFALNDPIGNNTPAVNARLGQGITDTVFSDNDATIAVDQVNTNDGQQLLNIEETVTLADNGDLIKRNKAGALTAGLWSNAVQKTINGSTETVFYWANPSYFQPIKGSSKKGYYYEHDGSLTPSWKDISGLTLPGILNPNHADIGGTAVTKLPGHGTAKPLVPGLPMATTAEEWVLINNSDIGHPFHIHINPFFAVEVGQLSYETFADSGKNGKPPGQWIMRAQRAESVGPALPIKDATTKTPAVATVFQGTSQVAKFVGKWWDTVIVPPHGYVKVRYWMNVPNQTGFGVNVAVADDFSKTGIWVYHCHILRHEDRGMMMPVITQPAYTKP